MSNEIILNADLRVRTGTNKTREIRRKIRWFLQLFMEMKKNQRISN